MHQNIVGSINLAIKEQNLDLGYFGVMEMRDILSSLPHRLVSLFTAKYGC